MKRREFITLPAKTAAGLLLSTLTSAEVRVRAQEPTVKVPLRFFTAAEASVIEAACDRIFPSDAMGPGAKEAGVVVFIDRQLAGPYGADTRRYTKPPFAESVPEHGYQGKDTPRELYRAGIKTLGADFAALSPAARDEKLHAIEMTVFFRLLRQHTLEGMFSDPMHGGNENLVGWQLIGYPGPVMTYRDVIDKNPGVAFRRAPASLAQIVGHPVKGMED